MYSLAVNFSKYCLFFNILNIYKCYLLNCRLSQSELSHLPPYLTCILSLHLQKKKKKKEKLILYLEKLHYCEKLYIIIMIIIITRVKDAFTVL